MTKNQQISPSDPFSLSHHLITLAAFRYALGRKSSIVGELVEWMQTHWGDIPAETKRIIIDETQLSLTLGFVVECDQQEWERFLEFAYKKSKFL